jgi:hypothetical protein
MDWDDNGPTEEQTILWNNELSPTEKKLLIQKSRIEGYHTGLILVLLVLLMGAVGALVRGWLATGIDVVIFWSFAITYTVLEDKKKKVESALAEEYEEQRKAKAQSRRRKKTSN